ncbi:DUF692 domain-containing protein [Azohydromonas caseinilytica]|uniref:DUF692 domain-containing protein n=1 Tax=Azohydromonas caseinilytica TaxID=2728836 RepID=A0A848FFW6_9BURK|nr:DUF692 domain-containing protein [Azohydromonas caseinilytica]NML17143.1 DUF692 domain-containing protein [Azohydromonas caseinilytica]
MNAHASDAGVGVMFNGVLSDFLDRHPDAPDFLSVIPERFWNDLGRRAATRFVPLPDEVGLLDRLAARYPLVAHGIGLSIASASAFDLAHVRQLAQWHRRYRFRWISEHLSAVRVHTRITPDHHAGLALPIPWDDDMLQMLCERVSQVQDILGCQLLLENGVVYTPVPDTDMSEAEFLRALTRRTGCALLLDLHNLYVNSVNLDLSAFAFIDALDLGAVHEIHIAGGNWLYGAYLDSHAGPCADAVWPLLSYTAPRCPNLRGVTFEFHESYYPRLEVAGVLAQLTRARNAMTGKEGEQTCRSRASSAPLPT